MPESTEKYVRINADGSSDFVTTTRSPRLISEAMARQFAGDASFIMRNVFEANLKGFPAFRSHLISTQASRTVVTRLPFIRLNCHFELMKDGMLSPKFFHRNQPEKEKFIKSSLQWSPPEDMILMFACPLIGFNNPRITSSDSKPYLIAYNPQKQAWVLPLPNLYEDCSVCNGQFDGNGTSYQMAFEKCLQQFLLSDWNTDLINSTNAVYAQRMFRFVPASGETEQMNWHDDKAGDARSWQKFCTKVGTPVTVSVGGLL